MPPKVAAAWRAKPPASVSPQVDRDPAVVPAPGVRLEDFDAASLWDVPVAFVACAAALARKADATDADDVRRHFDLAGFADFLPAWTLEDVARATADGKIPVYAAWADRLRSRAVGLDALMNLSALRSFVTDQKALDDRIRSKA